MGWFFSYCSRADLIRELTKDFENENGRSKTVAHTCRGNVLWSVAEITVNTEGVHSTLAAGQSTRLIRCDLLQRSGSKWGYKPLEESMHPYYYTCPLAYLNMAPETSAEWRMLVRAYHTNLRMKKSVQSIASPS